MCNAHTWWLLNGEVAKSHRKVKDLEQLPDMEDFKHGGACSPRSPWSPREVMNTWRSETRFSARSAKSSTAGALSSRSRDPRL